MVKRAKESFLKFAVKLTSLLLKVNKLLPSSFHEIWKRTEQSNIGSRFARGAFWSLLGSFFSQGLMLIASIVVARILGKQEYGEMGMIRSTVNMFTVFAGFGMGVTATKYVAEYHKIDKIRTGKIIGLSTLFATCTGGIIAIVLLISAPTLALKTINAPMLVNEIRLSAIMLFFSSINGAQTGTLAGFEAFKTIATVNLISGLSALPIQIGFTLLFGLRGSVIGFGFNYLILWILNVIAVKKESKLAGIKIEYREAWDEWKILYKFSLPALLSGILVTPVIWACNAMLVNQPHGYEEMAIFDAANQWRNVILFIPAALASIALPLLSSSVGNQKLFNKILKLNIAVNFIISLTMAICISLFSTFIMKFYGVGFSDGRIVLIIMTFSTVLISINNVIGSAIAGKGQMWVGLILNFLWGILLLSCTYYFLKSGFGAKGLAYSFLISYFCHTILVTIYTFKFLSKKRIIE
jgi:O-antigen/teichoic acid export membrane protein